MGWAAAAVLAAVVLALGVKLWLLRHGMKGLRLDLIERRGQDTNILLSLPCRDKELRRLASSLNEELRLLRKERLRYQQGDRELKEAVVNVSHDLRTPLTALSGYVELLKGEALSPAGQRYLSQIEDRAQAMQAHDRGAVPVLPGGGGDRPHPGAGGPAGRGGGGAAVLLRGFQQKGVVPQLSCPRARTQRSTVRSPSPGCWGTS